MRLKNKILFSLLFSSAILFSQTKIEREESLEHNFNLKKINPIKTKAWVSISEHYKEIKDVHLRTLFNLDSNREEKFTIILNEFKFDYSKNRINEETLKHLLELAREVDLQNAINSYFAGGKVNLTEGRAVLHTALRNQLNTRILIDGANIMCDVKEALNKIKFFSTKVISGEWKGFTNKPITDIVNIGIGGSNLGPEMAVESLKYYKNHLKIHFVSNIDGDYIQELLKELNPETTLFVIVSKSFTTQETITNASTIKKWFLRSATKKDISKHFVAVSSNLKSVINFGIDQDNIFPMWNWIGGRFSLWGSVGLSISLAIGNDNFNELLIGGFEMDQHFKNAPFEENVPVILGLIGVWYSNFFDTDTEVILPYSQYLNKLPSYLQQLCMESNGKSVDRDGNKISYQTGSIIWGGVGTNSQHAFMQLLHQGTKLIPADFIGFRQSLYNNKDHHSKLMANFYAQTNALYLGKNKEEVAIDLKRKGRTKSLLPFKVSVGNKPSTTILIEKLTPRNLGSLIAFYEHKVFVQGIILNINSFDQFGVELGKELTKSFFEK